MTAAGEVASVLVMGVIVVAVIAARARIAIEEIRAEAKTKEEA